MTPNSFQTSLTSAIATLPTPKISNQTIVRNFKKGALEKGYCIKLSEIDFRIRDKFATILHTLHVMYQMEYQ